MSGYVIVIYPPKGNRISLPTYWTGKGKSWTTVRDDGHHYKTMYAAEYARTHTLGGIVKESATVEADA